VREASSLVDEAIAELDRLGMAPDLARAAALTGTVTRTASEPSTVERVTSVILFSDVVDSTRLTEELGAVPYRRRARQVEELVTSTITAHGGTLVTGISLGDGFIGLFPTVEQAVHAARRCASDVGATGLHLHLALTRGEILVDGPRIYGGPVNYAARLCALSGPDEILVSDAIREAARGIDGIAFVDRGVHEMKGIAGPQAVSGLVDDTRDDLTELRPTI
jgi:class 3 adenylate cyclase